MASLRDAAAHFSWDQRAGVEWVLKKKKPKD